MSTKQKINVEIVIRKDRYGRDQVWAYCDRPFPGCNEAAYDVGNSREAVFLNLQNRYELGESNFYFCN